MHIKVFLWSFATILVALLFYQTFVSMKAYFLKPTFATSVFLDQKDANLPDTTFCALSRSFVSLEKELNTRTSWFRIDHFCVIILMDAASLGSSTLFQSLFYSFRISISYPY